MLMIVKEGKATENDLLEQDGYIDSLQRQCHDLKVSIVKLSKKESEDLGSVGTPATVKVKSLEPPKFEGNIRQYGTFRKDYERLMFSVYGEDPYALKIITS